MQLPDIKTTRTNLFNQWRDEERAQVSRKQQVLILPKYLIPGYRFLRPGEEVEAGDLFWSERKKCYLPAKDKRGWRGTLAGTTIPWIREDESN